MAAPEAASNSTPITVNGEGSPATNDEFHGWMTLDATSPMKYQAFTPKRWDEEDVDIKITHCGVCASDLHVMRSGWLSFIHLFIPLSSLPF